MAWRRPGDKPLSEPMLASLLTHVCVTRPQCFKRQLVCKSSIVGEEFSIDFCPLFISLYITQVLPIIFFSQIILLCNNFFILYIVLCIVISHGRSFYSFL